MRKTKVVQEKTAFLRAQRKILQVAKYGFVFPQLMGVEEAQAILVLVNNRKAELVQRRKGLSLLAHELGGTVTFGAPTDIDLANVGNFIDVLKACANGENNVQYEASWATSYLEYMLFMDSQIEALVERAGSKNK